MKPNLNLNLEIVESNVKKVAGFIPISEDKIKEVEIIKILHSKWYWKVYLFFYNLGEKK